MLIRVLLGAVLLATVSGCLPHTRPESAEPPLTLVWPAPPARARIRFVAAIARPADLGVRPSFWRRLGESVTGSQEEWLVRPTAVVTTGPFLYVADPGAQALWRIDTARGRFERVRKVGDALLVSPVAVAVGRQGSIYVADSFLARVFVLGPDLRLRASIASRDARRPAGLAFDEARDRLYIADSAAHRVWIYSGGGTAIGAIGQRGAGDAEFNFPTHVAVDRAGAIYVTDSLGFRVQVFRPDGSFAGRFGHHGDSSGEFARPKGVAVDSEGHVYVVETLFDAVQIFDARGRFLLSFGERGLRPGQFWLPVGVFIDRDDRIYVADSYNQRLQVFQYLPGGGDE